ncbi:MAG: DUF3536 domain-containing protein [Chloroflexi bacterium]|jgi:alpha-amylase/alpha-mannosidase (GH57 family)|nr:DUF3536 domain-containing protein [Chloroflexota bacterium]
MTRGRLAIHAHLYQPVRADPFSGRVPDDLSAAPARNWTERVAAECYLPNAARGNYERISFDVGPTLATWLDAHAPATAARIAASDEGSNAVAGGFHHAILPLASARDRLTEIRWGLRDFELRFGRAAEGFWLPETAVDLATLRALAGERLRWTVLAPWQAADHDLETRQPYRLELGDGLDVVVAFYDGWLSTAVSFDGSATADADRFARDWVLPRLTSAGRGDGVAGHDGESPLAVIATDAELYGHHQRFRDLFLARLVAPDAASGDRGFDLVTLGAALRDAAAGSLPRATLVERTSWSCHHGVARWSGECPCTADGRWKGPLRAAFERLAGGIDAVTEAVVAREAAAAGIDPPPDPWAARDAYVDVVLGREEPAAFAAAWLGPLAGPDACRRFADLLEAQRWRLAMFTSDGWYWEDPDRVETRQVLRCAARAARITDGVARTTLEGRLVADLGLLRSPRRGLDGAAIYREALAEVGQPAPHG